VIHKPIFQFIAITVRERLLALPRPEFYYTRQGGKKKWLTLPFIPMNMADIDYTGNGENGRTSNTACHRQRSVRGVTGTCV